MEKPYGDPKMPLMFGSGGGNSNNVSLGMGGGDIPVQLKTGDCRWHHNSIWVSRVMAAEEAVVEAAWSSQ